MFSHHPDWETCFTSPQPSPETVVGLVECDTPSFAHYLNISVSGNSSHFTFTRWSDVCEIPLNCQTSFFLATVSWLFSLLQPFLPICPPISLTMTPLGRGVDLLSEDLVHCEACLAFTLIVLLHSGMQWLAILKNTGWPREKWRRGVLIIKYKSIHTDLPGTGTEQLCLQINPSEWVSEWVKKDFILLGSIKFGPWSSGWWFSLMSPDLSCPEDGCIRVRREADEGMQPSCQVLDKPVGAVLWPGVPAVALVELQQHWVPKEWGQPTTRTCSAARLFHQWIFFPLPWCLGHIPRWEWNYERVWNIIFTPDLNPKCVYRYSCTSKCWR